MARFKQDDIGKLVLLELDPTKHKIAKALGATKVQFCGKILDVSETYVKIQKQGFTPFLHSRSIEEIPYSLIKDYSW